MICKIRNWMHLDFCIAMSDSKKHMRSSKIECLPLDVAQNHNFFRCPVWLVNLSFLREHSQGKASQETRSHLSYLYVYNAYIIYIDVYILSLLPWSWCILIFISWRFSSSFSPPKKKCCLSARPWRLGDLWLGLSDSAPGMSRDVLMGKRMGNRFFTP